jgi:ankyrin repeat protein
MAAPTADEIEDALLSCRYGEFEEVQAFVASFGIEPLSDARDNNGNSCLHFCAANGHIGPSHIC